MKNRKSIQFARIFFVLLVFFYSLAHAQSWEDDIRRQIESNWNVDPKGNNVDVEVRVFLERDGTVTQVEILNNRPEDKSFRMIAESAVRAIKSSSPLKLPNGQYWPSLLLKFNPKEVIQ